jgi:hypothetical protein
MRWLLSACSRTNERPKLLFGLGSVGRIPLWLWCALPIGFDVAARNFALDFIGEPLRSVMSSGIARISRHAIMLHSRVNDYQSRAVVRHGRNILRKALAHAAIFNVCFFRFRRLGRYRARPCERYAGECDVSDCPHGTLPQVVEGYARSSSFARQAHCGGSGFLDSGVS